MNCPSDGTTLLMSERQGIEIDYCPQCRGIWLDRGELDKILERAQAEAEAFGSGAQAPAAPAASPAAPQQQYAQPRYEQPRYDDRSRDPRYNDPRYNDPRYRKKKSPFEFLGDLFE